MLDVTYVLVGEKEIDVQQILILFKGKRSDRIDRQRL